MNNCLLSSYKDYWETPDWLYNMLDENYHFTLDPCSNDKNHKCSKYYTIEDDGLSKSWKNEIVFCNPPYGKSIEKWVKKGLDELLINNVTSVFLLPARTDTKWYHEYCFLNAAIIFLRGRIKFKGALFSAPFPSMLVIFSKDQGIANGILDIRGYKDE